jgi:hypothetical protein
MAKRQKLESPENLKIISLVPYGQSQNNFNDYVLHVDPKYRDIPPPNFQLSNCKLLA